MSANKANHKKITCFDCEKIGFEANKLFSNDNHGFIHSVFKHAINSIISGNLITIFSKEDIGDWYGLNIKNVISFEGFFDDQDVNKQILVFKNNRLEIPHNNTVIDIKDCNYLYFPEFTNISFSKIQLLQNLNSILEYLNNKYLKNTFFKNGTIVLNNLISGIDSKKVTRKEYKCYINEFTIKALLGGLANNNIEIVENNIEKTIGSGIGFTPSGDDFLYGFISIFWLTSNFFKINEKEFNILKNSVIKYKHNTSLISQYLLLRAFNGKYSETVHDFLQNIFQKHLSTSKLNDILSKLLQIGYTSGFDTLLGICTGVYYLIHGTYGADV